MMISGTLSTPTMLLQEAAGRDESVWYSRERSIGMENEGMDYQEKVDGLEDAKIRALVLQTAQAMAPT